MEQNLDKEEIWMGCTPGFLDEIKEQAIKMAYDLGFRKVNWILTGGVITTHGTECFLYIRIFAGMNQADIRNPLRYLLITL